MDMNEALNKLRSCTVLHTAILNSGEEVEFFVSTDDLAVFGMEVIFAHPATFCTSLMLKDDSKMILFSQRAYEYVKAHNALLGVLAHEQGHLIHEHAKRGLEENANTVEQAGVQFLTDVKYEIEADQYAVDAGHGKEILAFLDSLPIASATCDRKYIEDHYHRLAVLRNTLEGTPIPTLVRKEENKNMSFTKAIQTIFDMFPI